MDLEIYDMTESPMKTQKNVEVTDSFGLFIKPVIFVICLITVVELLSRL